jgi:hypothetical protein
MTGNKRPKYLAFVSIALWGIFLVVWVQVGLNFVARPLVLADHTFRGIVAMILSFAPAPLSFTVGKRAGIHYS